MFFRLHTDGTRTPVALSGLWGGPFRTSCWILGGGPSLGSLPVQEIAASPAVKFGINLAGHGLLRPDVWTAYDPTSRFHRSVYLDGSILKLLHVRRGMDLVPETTFKVCECPATLFFERDPRCGFHDSLHSRQVIPDWQDTLIQAIALASQLGMRRLYLAGCELMVAPPPAIVEAAAQAGVEYRDREPLRDFHRRREAAGVRWSDGRASEQVRPYHFDETKPLASLLQMDDHYFRIVQTLRLCRRSLALAGVELISVTPDSRLNDHFPYCPVERAVSQIHAEVGDPALETTRGRYTQVDSRAPSGLAVMKDIRPHHRGREVRKQDPQAPRPTHDERGNGAAGRSEELRAIRSALQELPEIPVEIRDDR